MAGGKYQKKSLKFHKYSCESKRKQADKFCLVSEIWNAFVDNCQKCYVPNFIP